MNTEQINVLYQKLECDLDMEILNPARVYELKAKSIKITGTEIARDHTVYKIQVSIGECSWIVRKRYRDFCALHEELVVDHGLPWDLLPPKKFIGNMNPEHVEKRRAALEKYLQTLLAVLMDLPTELIEFLEFDRFDVNAVCHRLAKDLYEIGDSILTNDEVFTISPLQIHCINRRLLLPLPTCESEDPREDIGHLYDFINQAKHIKVKGGGHDETFVVDHDLTYDISIFKSLETLELCECDIELMSGLEVLQNQLWELKVIKSTKFLKDILITSQSWNQGILVEVQDGEQHHTYQLPIWDNIVHAAFTRMELTALDNTITLLPNIRKLDLSHNLLTDVQYLESFLYLRELDLSHNEITDVEDLPYKLGNITKLNLAGNHLRDVKGLDKMYSLKNLRLTDNAIEKLASVLILGNLPMLENVDLHGNPCTSEDYYNVRLLAQFGDRYQDVTIDGVPTIKSDLAKTLEIIKLQNSYEVITGPENYYRPGISVTSKAIEPVKSITPPRSPKTPVKRASKKGHVANIKPAESKKTRPGMDDIESEEAKFRDQVEKLREQAGASWLTFYNDLQAEETVNEQKVQQTSSPPVAANAVSIDDEKNASTQETPKTTKPVNKVKPMPPKEPPGPHDSTKEILRTKIRSIVKDENYEENLPGSIFNLLEDMMDQDIDLINETFLLMEENETTGLVEECIVTLDADDSSLLQIELTTGRTVGHFFLAKIRNLRVTKKRFYVIIFDEEKEQTDEGKGVWLEHKFKFQDAKDCAGLFALMKAFTESDNNENIMSHSSKTSSEEHLATKGTPIDNPFHLKNEILLSFLQEFVQKTSAVKRDPDSKPRSNTGGSYSSLAYQNIGISVPFLKHAVISDVPQDVVLTLWAGCLPYLFPEEELPTCLVMTNINIFLFRIFLPDDASPNSLPKTVKEMKEIFHCFYSFSLKSIKQVVVGLYDQAFRIEVTDEGPRGTFTFLTRHASKTSQFLESFCSIIGFSEEKNSLDMKRRTSFVSEDLNSSIVYPDESKIKALEERLTEQDLNPLDDRENLISYCIVYISDTEEDDDELLYSSDTPVSNIKSLILTNLRLFMCDEDYVHWPLPSFARTIPTTPEWVVDEDESVADLIGVDLWEVTDFKQNMAGNYGMTITFDNSVTELTETVKNEVYKKLWKVMFDSLSEREQFVRSLSCLWKNQFDQNLTVTYSRVVKPNINSDAVSQSSIPTNNFKPGHSRGASGNLSVPCIGPIDTPEMILALNPIRQNTYFIDNVALEEEERTKGLLFLMSTGCIPYVHPGREITVAVLLSCDQIYLVTSEEHRSLINAKKAIVDGSESSPLWLTTIALQDLRQVVAGVFDQFVRIEGDKPETTFTLIIRDHAKTNEFLTNLSQALLLRKHDGPNRDTRTDTTQNHIYKLYQEEDEKSGENDSKSEFIHPNSDVKFVYPSDESLDKLKQNILNFISESYKTDVDEDFGILLYLLVHAETDDGVLPCTLVISEKFICLLKEDYVNYPLPLFVKELPETPQYQPADARLIAAITRIEFQDLSAGSFSIVFNRAVVEPSCYDQRFKTASVEADACLITDLNTDRKVQEEQGALLWKLRTQSFEEREKIFNKLSKMWTNCYSGKTLPVVKRKHTRSGDW